MNSEIETEKKKQILEQCAQFISVPKAFEVPYDIQGEYYLPSDQSGEVWRDYTITIQVTTKALLIEP